MKQFDLRKIVLATGVVMSSLAVNAQVYHPLAFPATAGTNNYYSDYVGIRFTISNPQLEVAYTMSNDGSGTAGQWGGAVTTAILNMNIVKAAPDSLACSSLNQLPPNSMALIYRGDCEFGAKALQAQQKGAAAVLIVNNINGGPVGMAAGSQGGSVTIPVFMISKEDGDQLNAVLNNSQTSLASIIPWASGSTDEIAIINGGTSLWHLYAIPYHQLGTSNGNPMAYKVQHGAYMANFGTTPQTNVKLKGEVFWTPEGSTTPTLQTHDSFVATAAFPASDSIIAIYTDATPDLHATGKGRFDIKHTISSTTDIIPGNNVVTNSVYVNDKVFSKSRYDFANSRPMSNISYGSTGTTPILWGPVYYVAKGNGYSIDQLQFSVSDGTGGPMGHLQSVYVLKWKDGVGGPLDSLVDNGEVTLAGYGSKQFNGSVNDSSGKFFNVSILDNNNDTLMLEDDTWYWTVAEVAPSMFLGCDGTLNYLPRSVFRDKNSGVYEQYAPIYFGDFTNFQANTDGAIPFPFEATIQIDSVRFANQKDGIVPSIAMITSLFPSSVQSVQNNAVGQVTLYPNPASDKVNVSVALATKADKVSYTVLSVMGQVISKESHTSVQNDNFVINTSSYAAGNYYVVIMADGKAIFEKFTIVK